MSQAVKDTKPRERYGRHPINIVSHLVADGISGKSLAVYMALGDRLIDKSNTTIQLSDL